MKILFSEGSSLSARQALYALGPLGYQLDFVDPQAFHCIGAFSRYVRRRRRCPSFTADALGYVRCVLKLLERERYDVLLPVHDQAYLLARFGRLLRPRVGLALPDFDTLEQLQSKADFVRLLKRLDLPHPPTQFARNRGDLLEHAVFPCYIKLSYSTAGCGVWHVGDPEQLQRVIDRLDRAGLLDGQSEILIQEPAPGVLGVGQFVYQRGRLVGAHCYQARAQGIGGSALARVGVSHPIVLRHLAVLGAYLNWHGPLVVDYLFDPVTAIPRYIDANPRLGEPLNATLSGVNLADLLVQVSLDRELPPLVASRPGVATHSLMMALLGEAQTHHSRGRLLSMLAQAWRGRGLFAHSQDELARPGEDPASALPTIAVALRLLINPAAVRRIVAGAVGNYSLTEEAARAIRSLHGDSAEDQAAEALLKR